MLNLHIAVMFAAGLAFGPDEEPVPARVRDLEKQVRSVVERAVPATVAVIAGGSLGSGVIVSPDGHVLTVAHVFSRPGQRVRIVLHDGESVGGVTLGKQTNDDYGLIQLDGEREWPFVEMGESADLGRGTMCVALGHPGGYEKDRLPVTRLGTIVSTRGQFIQTSCAVVSGDSGGPLFDLAGEVIGIHSRISEDVTENYHVPIDRYRSEWSRLLASEDWGRERERSRRWGGGAARPRMGVSGENHENGCRITRVTDGRPAAVAGMKVGDVVTRFGETEIENWGALIAAIRGVKFGDRVAVRVLRDGETRDFDIEFAQPEDDG